MSLLTTLFQIENIFSYLLDGMKIGEIESRIFSIYILKTGTERFCVSVDEEERKFLARNLVKRVAFFSKIFKAVHNRVLRILSRR